MDWECIRNPLYPVRLLPDVCSHATFSLPKLRLLPDGQFPLYNFPKRGEGLFCHNNLYMAALFLPIIIIIPVLNLQDTQFQSILSILLILSKWINAILMLVYSSGLRVSEVVKLIVEDIDVERKLIHIKDAKERKDRYTMDVVILFIPAWLFLTVYTL